MVAGAEDEDVALAEPDALGLLCRLQSVRPDGLARLEPLDCPAAGACPAARPFPRCRARKP